MIGRFRVVEQIGQGGMGVVFRAVEENLGRHVALKVIAPVYAHDPDFRRRFNREARSQAALDSSHVVAVYAHGEESGYLYIASQLIPDGDLGQLLRARGVPPMVDALQIIQQVASGLSDAHRAGIVHRDIKPGNVLVRMDDHSVRAYLADFGIARRIDAEVTSVGPKAIGTPLYMAPELWAGAPADTSTDVYALGCVLWETVTGRPPYSGQHEVQLLTAHTTHPVPQLGGEGPAVGAVNHILRTSMAKNPRHRYPSVDAMRADVLVAMRIPPETRPVPTPSPWRSWWFLTAVALGVLIVAAGIGLAVLGA